MVRVAVWSEDLLCAKFKGSARLYAPNIMIISKLKITVMRTRNNNMACSRSIVDTLVLFQWLGILLAVADAFGPGLETLPGLSSSSSSSSSSPRRTEFRTSCVCRTTVLVCGGTTHQYHHFPGDNHDVSDSRRRLLQMGGVALPLTALEQQASADTTTTSNANPTVPLADLPMIRLQLPKAALGREYVAVKLMIDDQGPYDFMVDTGLTTELITPHLKQSLGLGKKTGGGGPKVQGLGAGGSTQGGELLKLKGASLCCGTFADPEASTLPLPPLDAIVADFPQEHIDPSHDPVEGMLGMEMLQLYDVDFDFPGGRLRLWAPGTAAVEASRVGLVEVPAAVLNESLLLGIRLTSPKAGPQSQPIAAIVDCGATFSAVNWAGAQLLGLPPKADQGFYKNSPVAAAVGVDGRPQYLPMKEIEFTFAGDADPTTRTFASPPAPWKPWKRVLTGIGDLPVFSQILGDGRTPYNGPAALVGLDVLAQRRVIFETGQSGRRRRLFISAS